MTTTIELDPNTAKALADYAAALGMTVQEYLKRQFTGADGPTPAVNNADRRLDELAEGFDLPPLPRDFSTKDLYADHD